MNFKTRQLGSSLQMALATAVLAAASLAAPVSHATVQMNTNGGASCKASFGDGAKLFYFSALYAENTSSSSQFLTCIIPEMNPGSSRSATQIEVAAINTTGAAVTVTCAISAGYPEFGGTVNTSVYSLNLAANGDDEIVSNAGSTPAIPARSTRWSPYTVNCIVPAHVRIGLISTIFPELF